MFDDPCRIFIGVAQNYLWVRAQPLLRWWMGTRASKSDRFRASILAKNPHAVITNLRSTKALGLTFPTALLDRANEVIE